MLFHVDNFTDVHIINRQATRSQLLAPLLRRLYAVALQYNVHLHARHRPGTENLLADFLSRPALHGHQHLARWSAAHPDRAAALSCVSLVSSGHFIGSSTSSPTSPSAPTLGSRTAPASAHFARFAAPSA
jgi:hypothetical protein